MQNILDVTSAFLAAHQVFATAVLWPVLTALVGYLLKKGPALGAVVHALGTDPSALVAALAGFLQKSPPAPVPTSPALAPPAASVPAPASPVAEAAKEALAAGLSSLEAAK